MPRVVFLSLLAVVLGATATPLSTSPYDIPSERSQYSSAPLLAAEHPHRTVNNSYIVMLKKHTTPVLLQNHMNFLQQTHEENPLVAEDAAFTGLRHIWDSHIKGYAGTFSEQVIDAIRQMPEVDYVEMDQIVRTLDMNVTSAHDTQIGAPWGLARVSHRQKLGLSTFTRYIYDPRGGEGVDVYVIDTGINVNHVEFEGRASWGKTIPQNDVDEDGNGHGTHCAGTIASKKYGVAKAANVIAVKVLGSNGSGTMSDVVAGVEWATTTAKAKDDAARDELAKTGKTKHKGSVANMSLGGGKSRTLDDAVNAAVDVGVHFAVAAGNDNRDACNYSPAAAENAVTVGASTMGDVRAYFSNYGKCVDVFAPGLNIKSTYIGSKYATTTMSGTSMASPHTAGMLAYLLSLYPSKDFNPSLSDDMVPPAMTLFAPASISDVYGVVHAALPSWITAMMPAPALVEDVAPTPKEPISITPKQLKKALLGLSTPDMLDDLGDEFTPNLLIFNNATA